MMHKEILNTNQAKLLPLLKKFSKNFGLAGGTAVALHIGHRKSIDFDLFTKKSLKHQEILNTIKKEYEIQSILVENPNELTLITNNLKLTFLYYPYKIIYEHNLENIIKIPDLLTLAATKAFALGKRAKWKDYVDLYFILKTHTFKQIVDKAEEIYKGEFNEKLFREQLSYHNDIDYSEHVDYQVGFETSDKTIKDKLTQVSLS